MRRHRRWMSALLAAVLAVGLVIPSGHAEEGGQPFAYFRIDAKSMDVPERTISVDIYQRDESGSFQVSDSVTYACKLNRTTGDASFYIQPNVESIWVSVDYLTDLNGDGTYEMLDGESTPVWDVMSANGGLAPQKEGETPALSGEETYILSPDMLEYRSGQAVKARSGDGAQAIDVGQGEVTEQEFPLCMIKLHHTDAAGQEQVQTYYLELYDEVLIPLDVSRGDWYYDAVEFVLAEGYFSGVGNGMFSPGGQLARAQLAQVLWNINGAPPSKASGFSDVADTDWFYFAVSWCRQEGLFTGYSDEIFAPADPLSREQVISVLYRYARYSGDSLRANADLSGFADSDSISPWALDSMKWAVTQGVLSSDGTHLRPGAPITRAEMAAVLYAYEQELGLD